MWPLPLGQKLANGVPLPPGFEKDKISHLNLYRACFLAGDRQENDLHILKSLFDLSQVN